nr:hypothetical protein GCM10020092_050780 [Actinoplanes digitatis]
MVIVTGAGPQSKVILPPAATALTTAAEVQLAGVPVPTTRSGLLVSTAFASAGTAALPAGLPGLGSAAGFAGALLLGATEELATGVDAPGAARAAGDAAGSGAAVPAEPQPVSMSAHVSAAILKRTGRY